MATLAPGHRGQRHMDIGIRCIETQGHSGTGAQGTEAQSTWYLGTQAHGYRPHGHISTEAQGHGGTRAHKQRAQGYRGAGTQRHADTGAQGHRGTGAQGQRGTGAQGLDWIGLGSHLFSPTVDFGQPPYGRCPSMHRTHLDTCASTSMCQLSNSWISSSHTCLSCAGSSLIHSCPVQAPGQAHPLCLLFGPIITLPPQTALLTMCPHPLPLLPQGGFVFHLHIDPSWSRYSHSWSE